MNSRRPFNVRWSCTVAIGVLILAVLGPCMGVYVYRAYLATPTSGALALRVRNACSFPLIVHVFGLTDYRARIRAWSAPLDAGASDVFFLDWEDNGWDVSQAQFFAIYARQEHSQDVALLVLDTLDIPMRTKSGSLKLKLSGFDIPAGVVLSEVTVHPEMFRAKELLLEETPITLGSEESMATTTKSDASAVPQ
jgi:hypothetical protein